jgi:AAA15 family ATPase/GTPase
MILKFRLKNYRSFKDEVIFWMNAGPSTYGEGWVIQDNPLEGGNFGRVLRAASIHGANASGKSNLIRAISDLKKFVVNPPKMGQPIRSYDPFRFHDRTASEAQIWELEFVNKDKHHFSYFLEILAHRVVAERLLIFGDDGERLLLNRNGNAEADSLSDSANILGPESTQLKVFGNQAALSRFGEDVPDELISRAYLYISEIEILNPTNPIMAEKLWGGIAESLAESPSLHTKLNQLIRIADTGILRFVTDLDTQKDSSTSKYSLYGIHAKLADDGNQNGEETRLPLQQESTGTQVLVTVGTKVLQVLDTGGVLFVDELETSFHPFVSRLLVSLFQSPRINSKSAQLIFSTHDTNLLDRRLLRRDQIWFVEKDEYGISTLYSLADFEDIPDDGEFEPMYLAGRLGAIPDIGSIEAQFEEA